MQITHRFTLYTIVLSTLLLFSACDKVPQTNIEIVKSQEGRHGMVVSAHPIASDIGLNILKEGGNAIEAAIAVQFALAVVCPRAGNIGGGGLAVIRDKNGVVNALDYREKAPLKAHRDMYLDSLGKVIPGLSTEGALAIGTPGTVDGMITLLKSYGTGKTLKELIKPSIDVAINGFEISKSEADRLNKFEPDFRKYASSDCPFIKDGAWEEGDLIVQSSLAATLMNIQDLGREGFYGTIAAEKLIEKIGDLGGILTQEDLNVYESKWRKPIEQAFADYNIISMPPPSSGGIVLSQILSMLAQVGFDSLEHNSIDYIHTIVELEKRAYADRAKYLGDSDYFDVPQDELLDVAYLQDKLKNFDIQSATTSDSILNKLDYEVLESYETTHTSVVDAYGNAISVTTTLNSNFGSKVFVEDLGFFLNNEMDDFSAKPGSQNLYGLVGGEANAIQPEKRMLSSMTPTIIEKNGDLFMILGSPGGSTIITSVLQVFLNVVLFDMNIEEAVAQKRYHHQWIPNHILYEKDCFTELQQKELVSRGHVLNETSAIGKVKAIHVNKGVMYGAGDPRNPDDSVSSY